MEKNERKHIRLINTRIGPAHPWSHLRRSRPRPAEYYLFQLVMSFNKILLFILLFMVLHLFQMGRKKKWKITLSNSIFSRVSYNNPTYRLTMNNPNLGGFWSWVRSGDLLLASHFEYKTKDKLQTYYKKF